MKPKHLAPLLLCLSTQACVAYRSGDLPETPQPATKRAAATTTASYDFQFTTFDNPNAVAQAEVAPVIDRELGATGVFKQGKAGAPGQPHVAIKVNNSGPLALGIITGIFSGLTLTVLPGYARDDYKMTAVVTKDGKEVKTYTYEGSVTTWMELLPGVRDALQRPQGEGAGHGDEHDPRPRERHGQGRHRRLTRARQALPARRASARSRAAGASGGQRGKCFRPARPVPAPARPAMNGACIESVGERFWTSQRQSAAWRPRDASPARPHRRSTAAAAARGLAAGDGGSGDGAGGGPDSGAGGAGGGGPSGGKYPVGIAGYEDGALRAAAVRAAIELAGGLPWLKTGNTVLVKVAHNSPNPYPATSSPVACAEVCKLLLEAGAKKVVVADLMGIENTLMPGGWALEDPFGGGGFDPAKDATVRAFKASGIWQAVEDAVGASNIGPNAPGAPHQLPRARLAPLRVGGRHGRHAAAGQRAG